jgi:hypothetical protein
MFNFKLMNSNPTNDFSSRLYDEKSFYTAFSKDISKAERSIVIESPYLTERRALQFSKILKRKAGDGVKITIYTRNPDHHDKVLEIQAWRALKILKASGASIFLADDMRHRKLAIIDSEVLWEGSLNIFSQSSSRELMRRTNSTVQCAEVLSYTKLQAKNRWYNHG